MGCSLKRPSVFKLPECLYMSRVLTSVRLSEEIVALFDINGNPVE